ncbi:hypothetical protein FE257_003693 [Aspergillus nanangensis]|uniref:Uncharacterized protein n=1 Tax=Aspergillus nanangensis TaxID=2582783 RepID=A0AAD4CSB9_ASPNN|nr:hypothetical protein FE257_003693 [Aspergillus nanangensis]
MFSPGLVRGMAAAPTAIKASLPIVICGKNPQVSSAVIAALHPDYTVAHSIQSPTAGVRDLPGFLRPGVGTEEQAATPVAVLIGGGYTDEDMKSMQDACRDGQPVVWLKVRPVDRDRSGPLPTFAEWGAEIGRRARDFLNQLRSQEQLGKDHTFYL